MKKEEPSSSKPFERVGFNSTQGQMTEFAVVG